VVVVFGSPQRVQKDTGCDVELHHLLLGPAGVQIRVAGSNQPPVGPTDLCGVGGWIDRQDAVQVPPQNIAAESHLSRPTPEVARSSWQVGFWMQVGQPVIIGN
jgi:hypothetical protein